MRWPDTDRRPRNASPAIVRDQLTPVRLSFSTHIHTVYLYSLLHFIPRPPLYSPFTSSPVSPSAKAGPTPPVSTTTRHSGRNFLPFPKQRISFPNTIDLLRWIFYADFSSFFFWYNIYLYVFVWWWWWWYEPMESYPLGDGCCRNINRFIWFHNLLLILLYRPQSQRALLSQGGLTSS